MSGFIILSNHAKIFVATASGSTSERLFRCERAAVFFRFSIARLQAYLRLNCFNLIFQADVDKAVRAAKNALKCSQWRYMDASDRGVLMNKLADKIDENKYYLAVR